MTYPDGSEFGGVGGLIQPPPHELTAREERMVQMAVVPDSPDDSREKAIRRLNEGGQFEYGKTESEQ